MKRITLILCLLIASITTIAQNKEVVKFMPLGDSYTICEGINTSFCWPNTLTKNLSEKKIDIMLLTNPSKSGYTSQDLIDNELPILAESDANFVTILIGVNDWVKNINEGVFASNLTYIVETVIEKVGSSNRILLITIPDFSATPEGEKFANGRDISKGIARFNEIIKETADYYGVNVVDIYPTTKNMKGNPELIAKDGLHPSEKEYAIWQELIATKAIELLDPK